MRSRIAIVLQAPWRGIKWCFRTRVRALASSLVLFGLFSGGSYGAYTYSMSPTFCYSCHLMEPYYESWQRSSHSEVTCVQCHFEPGIGHGGIGFVAEVKTVEEMPNIGELLTDVEPADLIKYGLIPEFVGRLPVVATLDELDEDALVTILVEPRNALTKQYAKLFEMEGAELEFREDALRAIAKRAMQRKTGARGLRTILESILLETMYDLPSLANAKKVVVDEAVVTGETHALRDSRKRRHDADAGGR